MSVKTLFDFITDPTVTEENMDDYLDKVSRMVNEEPSDNPENEIEEQVFKQAYIPQRLDEVVS